MGEGSAAAWQSSSSAEELQDKADRHRQAAHDSHLRLVEDEARAQNAENSSAG